MIEINRKLQSASPEADNVKIKIIGLGGAGSNALDRILLDGLEYAEAMVVNTDMQSLTASVAPRKIQIGRTTTRGLGTGGDPELGHAAAEEAADEISTALEDASLVFLCAGLGGGTGSGAAPAIAGIAREQGALVAAFVTLPFAFEGRRRCAQAEEALEALREAADIVVCFENDRMGETVSPQAGIHQAFAASDATISQSIRAVSELFKRPGLMRIGFDDLARVMGGRHARCLFGHGESESDNRANEAIARALKSPLMDRGRMLDEANAVLVNVVGGPTMTLNEVQIMMDELNRHMGRDTQLFFGTAIDPKAGDRMSITIISSLGGEAVQAPAVSRIPEKAAQPPKVRVQKPAVQETPRVLVPEPEAFTPAPEPFFAEAPEPVADSFDAPEPEEEPRIIAEAVAELVEAPQTEPVEEAVIEPEPIPVPVVATKSARTIPRHMRSNPEPQLPMDIPQTKVPQQESLPFEPVSRGRFEKSEPTIVDGQDLDVPTFMRRNVRIK